jgi:alkylhydroperoxidase/carboxymuconolactone decarboxylase family protein YurZ
VITHATFYSGWPTGVQGAVIAKKVFESRGL